MNAERAAQRVKFIERYRSYVINYNLGEDIVRSYIERRGGTPNQPEKRWREFELLLSMPHLPSELQQAEQPSQPRLRQAARFVTPEKSRA